MWQFLRGIYTVIFCCLLPWIGFRLWVRSLSLPAYRDRWSERFGRTSLPLLKQTIWVHAVSVGEALSALPLIYRLHEKYPHLPLLITTTTPTSSERVQTACKEILGKHLYHCYLPYDLPWVLRAFCRQINPQLLILMETELWPNLLHLCAQRQLPVLIANGRLSLVSTQRYRWLGRVLTQMLAPIYGVAAQSEMDAQRFQSLGISAERIWQTGNIKFDVNLPADIVTAGKKLRLMLGEERAVWIATSTHEGEERLLLKVYALLKKQLPHLLLFLVPRHPERFNKVANLCLTQDLALIKRSQKQKCSLKTDVFLGDSMGELLLFYAASDVAFVGGSLVKVGGHNLLEPAMLGLALLSGPHLFNFMEISQRLIKAKAMIVVQNEKELAIEVQRLLSDEKARTSQGQRAKAVVEQNRGALEKLLQLIALRVR